MAGKFLDDVGLAHLWSKIKNLNPKAHASSGTTFGVGSTSNYGHLKIGTGAGDAAAGNHTHSSGVATCEMSTITSTQITVIGGGGSQANNYKPYAGPWTMYKFNIVGVKYWEAYCTAIGQIDVHSGTTNASSASYSFPSLTLPTGFSNGRGPYPTTAWLASQLGPTHAAIPEFVKCSISGNNIAMSDGFAAVPLVVTRNGVVGWLVNIITSQTISQITSSSSNDEWIFIVFKRSGTWV